MKSPALKLMPHAPRAQNGVNFCTATEYLSYHQHCAKNDVYCSDGWLLLITYIWQQYSFWQSNIKQFTVQEDVYPSNFDDFIKIQNWYWQYDHLRKCGTLSPQPLCLEKHPGEVPTVGESVPAVQLTPPRIHKWRGVVSKDISEIWKLYALQ